MTLTRTERGEVVHPSGATQQLAVVLAFPPRFGAPTIVEPTSNDLPVGMARIESPHPDPAEASHALTFLADLLTDPRSMLTDRQQSEASAELDDLLVDAAEDVLREDPECPVLEYPGRCAAAALRIVIQRGLIREEWAT